MLDKLRFCLVTDIDKPFPEYERFLKEVLEGGVQSVQLRAKSKNENDIYDLAYQLKKYLKPYQIPLIINDHIDIAVEIDAEGIHLGQSDKSPLLARKRLGPNKIIGLSIESETELEKANALTCLDYVAASAVFESKTKRNLKRIWGLEGLKKLSQASKYPVLAIGGIELTNVDAVLSHGAYGIALISALHEAANPKALAGAFLEKIKFQKED
ncbi:MAG: thiamine phosphate synthase [Proteobacteria bacterium]|nr:thiamine phosphate synthase [Pseudomonadota bacterium]